MSNIFNLKVRPKYLYQQYRDNQWLLDFFNLLDSYKQETYYSRIKEFIQARDILHSNSDYLQFYTRYLLGIYKPLGSTSVATYYDTGDIYDREDRPLIYDDSAVYDGTISQEQYITYLRFICNYDWEICNIDFTCNFVASWCKIKIEDIKLKYGPGPKIKVNLPLNEKTSDFVKLTINYGDVMGWPKGVDLDFRIEED